MQIRERIEVALIIIGLILLYSNSQQLDEQSACRDWAAISGRAEP